MNEEGFELVKNSLSRNRRTANLVGQVTPTQQEHRRRTCHRCNHCSGCSMCLVSIGENWWLTVVRRKVVRRISCRS